MNLTGEIKELAFGGEGIVHHEGMVVFVPFTAKGDLIEYQITQQKKRFARGKLLNIIQPASSRAKPVCPHFTRCGGCQLQHLVYPEQLHHKQKALADALERIGGLPLSAEAFKPIIGAEQTLAYRQHITLNFKTDEQGSLHLGFYSVDASHLEEISACLLFSDEQQMIINLKALIQRLNGISHGRVTILKTNNQPLLHFQFEETLSKKHLDLFQSNASTKEWGGISVTAPHAIYKWGKESTFWNIDNLHFELSPLAFLQNNREQSTKIYRKIVELASKYTPTSILDLYCGIGIISLLLAQKFSEKSAILGVEGNPFAIEQARKNADRNGLAYVNFERADVTHHLHGLIKKSTFDLIVVNPPRTGLDPKVIQALLKASPKQLIYLSCMPATLARDLKLLSQSFHIQECQPYDMFPQTAHLETLVELTRNDLRDKGQKTKRT